MALITVNTPFNIDLEFSLAPFYKRMLAWVIDLLVIFVYCYIMIFFVYGAVAGKSQLNQMMESKLSLFLTTTTILIPVMAYNLLFEVFMNGRSPGKYFLGIKVINMEGASATLSQLMLRWILFLPNYCLIVVVGIDSPGALIGVMMLLGIVALPDVICIAVTKHSQRFGDLAAGTVIVDTKYSMDIQETIYVDLEGVEYVPVFPQVLKLTDRDINGIRNLLNGKATGETENYMLRVAYRIEEVLQIKMNGEPKYFLQTLLIDYNFLTQNR